MHPSTAFVALAIGSILILATACSRPGEKTRDATLDAGRALHGRVCAVCHQANGQGVPGVFPPLAGSSVVNGDPAQLIRVVLHGLQGPLEANGTTYNSVMPPQGELLQDQEVAAVLSYIRSAWGHAAPRVTADMVAAERTATPRPTTAAVKKLNPPLAPNSAKLPTHDLRGEVVGLNVERRTLLVHHDAIPGYMPEMTMEFTLGGAEVDGFKEGQRIAARMVEEWPGEFRLDGVRIVDPEKDRIIAEASRELALDTFIRGKGAYREVGEQVPSFTLYDQEGEVVSFDRFRGKRVVLNFIFTRCPVATMCPAATARMAGLQRIARERAVPDLELVSITLDPAYDTPPVLKAYARARGIDPGNFHFLTGPEPAIRKLLAQFGIIATAGDNFWKHTLATVLIDRTGKIVHRIDGSTWAAEDILQRL